VRITSVCYSHQYKAWDRDPRLLYSNPEVGAGTITLSGGKRRLLELARALMVDPDVMMPDEPVTGLEPRFIDDIFERIE